MPSNVKSGKILHCKECNDIAAELGFCYNLFQKTDNDIKLHTHDYYELCFLPYDACDHYVNDNYYTLEAGTLLFIRPDDCHDFINPELNNITILHLAIAKNIIQSLFSFFGTAFPSAQLLSAQKPPYIVLNALERKQLITYFDKYNVISTADTDKKRIFMCSLLATLFADFFSNYSENSLVPSPDAPKWLLKTCEDMKKLSNFSQGLDRMVELSNVSKEYLCRCLKKYLNTTASEYINELRLNYITNMLVNSNESIVNICYNSGFSNMSWMYPLFKKKFGVSPAEFRKQNMKLLPQISKGIATPPEKI